MRGDDCECQYLLQATGPPNVRNLSDTEAYTVYDHVFSKTVRSLSHVVGVRKLTQPFWDRWRASDIGDETIFRFLEGVRTIDNWPSVGLRLAREEIAAFERQRPSLTRGEEVAGLRRLSYLCNMAHWGTLPLCHEKRESYRLCRDYYIAAETLAFPDRYRRFAVAWKGGDLHANLHLSSCGRPAPVVVIVHGIDGCKEEHLATELALVEAGLAVIGLDGPGQAEALLMDGILWDEDFFSAISLAVDAAAAEDARVDAGRVGLFGISIGGMWALKAAATDGRVEALYDLGGPINTRKFPSLPFIIKTKLCQVTGARDGASIAEVLGKNSVEDDAVLARVGAAVRMIHGDRDRVVSVADKEWLRDRLLALGGTGDVGLQVLADGDHCCTGHAAWIRQDMAAFFRRTLLGDATGSGPR